MNPPDFLHDRLAAELDAAVADFRACPVDQGPYPLAAADTLVLKVREGGRVVKAHAPVATGVDGDRHREILGRGRRRRVGSFWATARSPSG